MYYWPNSGAKTEYRSSIIKQHCYSSYELFNFDQRSLLQSQQLLSMFFSCCQPRHWEQFISQTVNHSKFQLVRPHLLQSWSTVSLLHQDLGLMTWHVLTHAIWLSSCFPHRQQYPLSNCFFFLLVHDRGFNIMTYCNCAILFLKPSENIHWVLLLPLYSE